MESLSPLACAQVTLHIAGREKALIATAATATWLSRVPARIDISYTFGKPRMQSERVRRMFRSFIAHHVYFWPGRGVPGASTSSRTPSVNGARTDRCCHVVAGWQLLRCPAPARRPSTTSSLPIVSILLDPRHPASAFLPLGLVRALLEQPYRLLTAYRMH